MFSNLYLPTFPANAANIRSIPLYSIDTQHSYNRLLRYSFDNCLMNRHCLLPMEKEVEWPEVGLDRIHLGTQMMPTSTIFLLFHNRC
jgi:hypothetical protein